MDSFFLLIMLAAGAYVLKSRDQGRRIALLGSYLGKYQLEKLMEGLSSGYLRALGEDDAQRRQQVWNFLNASELALSEQFDRFVTEMATVDEAEVRVSKLALALPFADKIFPNSTFDLRKLLKIHAQGIQRAVKNEQALSAKDKAFTLSAELFLMQHTCHWFCRSKTVASVRLLRQHQTAYEQVLEAVSPETRAAYLALIAG